MLTHPWKRKSWPARRQDSDLKPVLGDSGLPILGNTIEFFREGPDFALHMYRNHGQLFYSAPPILRSLSSRALTPSRPCSPTKTRDFSRSSGGR